jgi:hypothetical protein
MNHSIFKLLLTLVVGLTLVLSRSALAQPQSQQPQPQHIWGAATNGICAGVEVMQSDWPSHKNDFYCDIDVRNMSTNRLYIWVPPVEQRYEIELRGPDGRRIRQLKPLTHVQAHLWLARESFGQDPFSEKSNLDWFFLKDTFDVRTNGLYTLIVSTRVNAYTNFAIGRSQMRSEPSYFLLPPVTNTFNVSLPKPNK